MAKAVDGLQGIAHGEQASRLTDQRVEQAHLQRVGVLKLVDHDVAVARTVGRANRGVALQQGQGVELQVGEIEHGAG